MRATSIITTLVTKIQFTTRAITRGAAQSIKAGATASSAPSRARLELIVLNFWVLSSTSTITGCLIQYTLQTG
ncbi:TPA: hypothetical protein N0F65_005325 [Lagenidium giganteum]|uniref:Uncharacterized protein n=1 Tax=Lagenidium giganteum TaxID=4803 RepID=A0AAV2YWI6_9STRA|nr:TPA: hypothetical protein N0F65_005325 [Lagenidium giganteum]